MEKSPFEADNKKKVAVIIAVVVVAIIVCAAAFGSIGQESEPAAEPTPTATVSQEVTAVVNVTVKADGTNGESTKAQVEILNEAGEAAVPAMEVTANEQVAVGEIAEGKYSLRVVQAPVNTDGSTYTLPESPTEFSVEANGEPVSVEVTLEKLAVEDMSKEQLEATANVLEDNGKTNEAAAVKAEATAAPSRPGSAGQVTSTSSSNNGTSGSNTGNSSSDNKSSHTHNWVEQTKTVHHDAEYKTVHHDAVTESVVVCLTCGAENPGRDHIMQHAMEGANTATTVKTVTVQEAYDEKVLVKAAWDETVVTGYKCSGCGATK